MVYSQGISKETDQSELEKFTSIFVLYEPTSCGVVVLSNDTSIPSTLFLYDRLGVFPVYSKEFSLNTNIGFTL